MPTELPAGLHNLIATIPLWPLLATIGIGLILAFRAGHKFAAALTIGGVGISAALAVTLLVNLLVNLPEHAADHGAATAAAAEHHGDPHDESIAGDKNKKQIDAFDFEQPNTYPIARWISLGAPAPLAGTPQPWIDLNFVVDNLTAVMLVFVCVVSLMVVIYAVGYMKDHHGHREVGYERFFAFLALFVFSMCTLVMAGNFVLLYLGWELVGLCSYLLIGFYFRKPEAAAAAKKAFLVNRIGDFGFALGIFAIYWVLTSPLDPGAAIIAHGENPFDYAVVFGYAEQIAGAELFGFNAATVISLLLLCGALGKSAQFPLYVWLPDAMEGPTPVSALIHAATMVTAGVYMVARCGPIFYAAEPIVMDVVLAIGMIGAVGAATMALAQYDMKRILAYSTISQLAYMFVGLGCFVPMSAIFHVYTHAFFKALLFLTAGSVMHAMGNVIDLRQFGGLKRTLPVTYLQMLIGCLALAGVPLLAGFWSKDEIVHAAFIRAPWVGWVMTLTAGLTAYYTFRMFFLCFNGPRRLPKEAGDHPHEMPSVMTGPLWVLALGAIFAGYVGVTFTWDPATAFLGALQPHGLFHAFLDSASTIPHVAHHAGDVWIMYVSGGVALLGIGLAYVRYGQAPVDDPDAKALGPVFNVFHHKYWVDELYDRALVRPLRGLGHFSFGTDRFGINGLIWLVAAVPRALGALVKIFQRGALQGYALGMAAGTVLMLILWRWVSNGN